MNIGSAYINMMADLNPMRKSFRDARQDVDRFVDNAERGASGISRAFSGVRDMMRGVFQGAGMAAFSAALSGIGGIARGVGDALFGLNNQSEAAQAKINAFTKDAGLTANILEAVRTEASKTPFAFQEMANATAALMPVAKQAGIAWEDLLKQAEILAASNPMEGLEGASFALREAMTGDFTSIIERFNLSRQSINKWKEEGVDNMEIVRRAMAEMGYDSGLVSAMAETMAGKWSTFNDSLDGFKIALTKPVFDFLKEMLTLLQGLVDRNTERITAFATALGTGLANGMRTAIGAVQALYHGLSESDRYTASTASGLVNVGRAAAEAWESIVDFAGRVRDTALRVRDGFEQLRSSLMHGDFTGGGPFSEDSPLVLGLLHVNDLARSAADRFAEMRQRASEVQLPSTLGGGSLGDRVADIPLPTGEQAGTAAIAGGAAMGLVALLPMLSALAPSIAPLMALLPALGGLLGALVSPLGLVAAAVAVLGVAWVQNWGDIQGRTREAVAFIQPYLQQFAEFMRGPFMAGVSEAWDRFSRFALEGTARLRDYLTNDLMPQLRELGATVGPALSQMGDAMRRTFDTLQPYVLNFIGAVRELGAAFLPIAREIVAYAVDSFGPAIAGVIGFLTETIPLISAAFDNVLRVVTPILQGILSIATTVLGGLAGFVREHGDTILTILKAAWDNISLVVQTAWAFVTGLLQAGLKLLSGDWRGAWDEVKQTFSTIWDNIKQIAENAWTIFKGIFDLGLEAIKDLWSKAWGWVSERFSQISGEIRTTLDNWSNGLKTALDNAANGLKSAVLAPWEAARDAIGGVMSAFKDKLLGPLREARDGLQNFFNGVSNLVTKVAGFFGLEIKIEAPALPQFATGTGALGTGTWAWVGEGRDGKASGSELAYLPAGSKVIPHEQSMAMVRAGAVAPPGPSSPLPGYAFGLGLDDIPGLGGLAGLLGKGADAIVNITIETLGIEAPKLPGGLGDLGPAMFNKIKEWLIDAVADWKEDLAPGVSLSAAMEFALSQLGKPYQWGGNGNPSYDCSGFANAVAGAAGVGAGMPRVVYDIYNWAEKGKHPLFTFGFQNPTNPDPRIQHIGVGIAGNNGMEWFEAGGRAGGIGRTTDYWQTYGFPPGLDERLAEGGRGPGGAAPWNSQAPPHVVDWLLRGLAAGGGPASWLAGADIIAWHESNYNPLAQNNWDVNALAGNPSMGLMQVIRDHFLPGEDPWDPVTNVAAATRYIRRRYGDMYNVPGPQSVLAGGPYKPYANGGVITEPVTGVGLHSGIQYLIGEVGREIVFTPQQLEWLYGYFFHALTTGETSNVWLSKFPTEVRPLLRKAAQAYLDRLATASGANPNPLQSVPSDQNPAMPPPAHPMMPNGLPWMDQPQPPPPAHPIMPNGLPWHTPPTGPDGQQPAGWRRGPNGQLIPFYRGPAGTGYLGSGLNEDEYYWSLRPDKTEPLPNDPGIFGPNNPTGNPAPWMPKGGPNPPMHSPIPTGIPKTDEGGAGPPSQFPEPVSPDQNWKGLFKGTSGKMYAPDGQQVRHLSARYWVGVKDGATYDGYTGKKVSEGDGSYQPSTGPAAPKTLPAPAGSGIPDTPPASGGGGGGGKGGGSATISLQLTNRFEMPDGQIIVQTIVTDPIALDDLAEGVTEVQAREIEKRSDPGGGTTVPITPPVVKEPIPEYRL